MTLASFSRSHQHFECQILTKNSLSAPYFLKQMMDSGQTLCIVSLEQLKDLIRFWWPWPNFQGHHTIKTVKMSLVCTLSPEPIDGFCPNLHRNTIGKLERSDQILVTLTSFSRSHQHLEWQILTKNSLSAPYLLNQMMNSGWTLCIVSLGLLNDLVRFWWPWPNFQGHHIINTVKISLVCTLSPEPIDGFWPNLHRNTIGTRERND